MGEPEITRTKMGFSWDFHGDLSGTFMTFNGIFMGV
jgi:hypothetical protein